MATVPLRKSDGGGPVVVTALGLASALGGVVGACAASRAGIRRARELDHLPVFSRADGSVQGVTAHQAIETTRGFEGWARRLRLMHAGLDDLGASFDSGRLRDFRAGFYLALGPRRPADETADAGDPERLVTTAARLARWRTTPRIVFTTTVGHTGTAEAVARASEDLRDGTVELAIVGAIDSLLDEDAIAWMEDTERLKTPNRPAGLEPGEAAVFFTLTQDDRAQASGLPRLASVAGVSFAEEDRCMTSGKPSLGRGLARAILGASHTESGHPWLVTDHNGETYRASEWGHAAVHLRAASEAFDAPSIWYPAATFGDTGAAAGAVGVCVVTRAFARGYAPAPSATIACAADSSARAAIVLHAGSAPAAKGTRP